MKINANKVVRLEKELYIYTMELEQQGEEHPISKFLKQGVFALTRYLRAAAYVNIKQLNDIHKHKAIKDLK